MEEVKLFTKQDLERAARLAVSFYIAEDQLGSSFHEGAADPELCIVRAVRSVSADAPDYLDLPTVKALYKLLVGSERDFEEALRHVQSQL